CARPSAYRASDHRRRSLSLLSGALLDSEPGGADYRVGHRRAGRAAYDARADRLGRHERVDELERVDAEASRELAAPAMRLGGHLQQRLAELQPCARR